MRSGVGGVSACMLVLWRSQQALLHRHTRTRKTVFNFEGITFGSVCVHSGNHNNAISAGKVEPAWRSVLRETA